MNVLLPESVSLVLASALCIASFFTSALTAAFGIGGGVALLALMGLVLPVGALIPVHGAVQLGSNAGRAWILRADVEWRACIAFLAGALAGAAAGAGLVVALDDGLLKIVLGAFILIAVWWKVPALRSAGTAVHAAGGAVTTFVSMFVGASGPLVLALFEKAFGDRRALVGTHAAAMTAQHSVKIAAFALAGFAFGTWLPLIAAMIAAGYAGTVAGSRLLERMREVDFRRGFRVLMSLLALVMIAQGLWLLAR